ncbi:hypothetical protein CVT26_000371 [Gymnopilus dilepis]|uniref:PQ-loop repeat-containing protein 1 n=1 Tax=Gymnopilus dilepis TaxID=231916 RepID=A0A409VHR0_9AGAR|nr:hypothetical protein CVT26_000371 [Gymnopilus dilepis]
MVATWLSTAASVGMAVGPPLVYADQAYSIVKKKSVRPCLYQINKDFRDSTGFSRDVCAILLLANITRCFFWLGYVCHGFAVESMILALLYICICYRPNTSPEAFGTSTRPLSFWQWPTYSQYIEFLAGWMCVSFLSKLFFAAHLESSLCLAILFLIFGRSEIFVAILGFFALGLESTLPIPQLMSNYRQRSLYGFRMSTLLGWLGGDAFKTAYFFLQQTPLQFRVCAVFQLSIDFAIIGQRIMYGNAPPVSALLAQHDELEQALILGEEE